MHDRLFTPEGRHWDYFRAPGKGFDFHNFHIWWKPGICKKIQKSCTWTLFIGKSSRHCTYTLSTIWGPNWACFRSMDRGFRDAGRFSKLPYLGMNLITGRKLYIHSVSTPGVKIGLMFFCILWAAVSEIWADFQNCHIWAWDLPWTKFQKLHIHAIPQRVSLISLYTGSGFQDMGRFSKLSYLGMKFDWPLVKYPEVARQFYFYPTGSKLRLLSFFGRFPQVYGPIFKIDIFGYIWSIQYFSSIFLINTGMYCHPSCTKGYNCKTLHYSRHTLISAKVIFVCFYCQCNRRF